MVADSLTLGLSAAAPLAATPGCRRRYLDLHSDVEALRDNRAGLGQAGSIPDPSSVRRYPIRDRSSTLFCPRLAHS